ncbi:uncharacterized protein C5orf47 homolog [Colius striatus]|uniref:uncharacterized protein C5orf47 homolog n=1 Tax=Colius striatus TaxID=57412 RepID=UPI002B1D7D8E|nr:uncharacterized protein C5orf47 homolog [Colius striatus]
MEPRRSQRGPRVPLVYVNSFGSHRCGSIIRYGVDCWQPEVGRAVPVLPQPSPAEKGRKRRTEGSPEPCASSSVQVVGRSCGRVKPCSRHHGDLQEAKADAFDFPFPSRNVDKVIQRKKQKSKVWLKVSKVISKMLEENEKFRSRLLTCSQFDGAGNDTNQSAKNEASCLDRDKSMFDWIEQKKRDSIQKEIEKVV